MHLFGAALLLFCCSSAAAVDLVESASFGWGKVISPNSFGIPGWSISGDGHVPQLLTDKIILTPPYPGNKRGAIWSDEKNNLGEWTVEFQFRAGGPERGSGNIQLWYAKDGQKSVGTSSIYTVGKFDGLVLVVDAHGGRAGSVRGFLNDGSTDYSTHHGVDSLAFGHCDYAYRNLGRPSVIQIKLAANAFEVLVDGSQCFRTEKISLPSDYQFGVTSASSETPDSFEVFKFLLSRSATIPRPPPVSQRADEQQQQQQQSQPPSSSEDRPASEYTSSDSQFADLHNRLQQMNHAMNNLFREVATLSSKSAERHGDLIQQQQHRGSSDGGAGAGISPAQFNSLDNRLQSMERTLGDLKRDIGGVDHAGQYGKLYDKMVDTQDRLLHHLPTTMTESKPGHFPFILLQPQAILTN